MNFPQIQNLKGIQSKLWDKIKSTAPEAPPTKPTIGLKKKNENKKNQWCLGGIISPVMQLPYVYFQNMISWLY